MLRKLAYVAAILIAASVLCSLRAAQPQPSQSKKAEARQPDMELYDRAAADVQRKRYVAARLLLSTLINTYPDSEFLPKAHLVLAQSWYREGGERNLAQARDECKQTMQLYPGSPEAAEAEQLMGKIEAQAGNKGSPPPE